MYTSLYPALISATERRFAEQLGEYRTVTELHLQILWLEQWLRLPLKAVSGQQIEVISPGTWNFCAGPDFLRAHLRIDQRDLYGDIEIHLAEESWWRHGHAIDDRYSDVVLHLFLYPMSTSSMPASSMSASSMSSSSISASGRSTLPSVSSSSREDRYRALFELNLATHLPVTLDEIVQRIDLELYPFHLRSQPGRCARELFGQIPEQETMLIFQEAAYWRLQMKRSALLEQAGDYNRAALLGCVESLGYPRNASAFRQLLAALWERREQTEPELLAYALLLTGYFNETFHKKWHTDSYYQQLHALAQPMRASVRDTKAIRLEQGAVRPLSHPIRRIVLIIKWLKSSTLQSQLFDRLLQLWKAHAPQLHLPRRSSQLLKAIRALFSLTEDPHWSAHYTFEKQSSRQTLTLMGEEIFQRLLINALLPLLEGYILSHGDVTELEQVRDFYHSLPAIASGKRDHLYQRFFYFMEQPQLLKSADIEQGALQLHRDFCMHYETSCEGCPFVSRYRTLVMGKP